MKLTLLILSSALLLSTAALAQSAFTAQSVRRSGSFRAEAPIATAFPLFGPVREKDWADDWDPTILHPADVLVAENMVFTVPHGDDVTIWTIVAYDPAQHSISYVNVTPGVRVVRVDVRCASAGTSSTDVHVTYTYTGLSEKGNAMIDGYSQQTHDDRMQEWAAAINHYLRTGKRLASGKAE